MKLEMVPQLHMQQTLSQRLQQSAQILQLSAQELQTLVQDSLQDNPLLEPGPEPAPPYGRVCPILSPAKAPTWSISTT